MSVFNRFQSDTDAFIYTLGDMVILWNRVEMMARDLLRRLGVGSWALQMTISQLGNVSLTGSLREIAKLENHSHLEHITHFAELMDRLREYRNFYAHGVSHVNASGLGHISMVEAKEKLTFVDQDVSLKQLHAINKSMNECCLYGFAIAIGFDETLARLVPQSQVLWPLPQKPALPDRLKKARVSLKDWIRDSQS